MLAELESYLRKNKKTKTKLIEEFCLNSDFIKKTREKKLEIINKTRLFPVPAYEDRCNITLNLYNYCLAKKDFNFYNNLDYICELVSFSDGVVLIFRQDHITFGQNRKIKAFTLKELEFFDEKLCKIIRNENKSLFVANNDPNKEPKIVLGITEDLIGRLHWQQNLLFQSIFKLLYKGKTIYYAIIKKEDTIDRTTYFNLKFYNGRFNFKTKGSSHYFES